MAKSPQKTSWLHRFIPNPAKLKHNKSLQFLGHHLHNPALWRFERGSCARGVFIGLFFALMPMPFQMLCGAIFGIIARANLLFSIGLVWVTNPLTMGPIMIFAYEVGRRVLGDPPLHESTLTLKHIMLDFNDIWKPLLTGCFITGIVLGFIGFCIVHVTWQIWLKKKLRQT